MAAGHEAAAESCWTLDDVPLHLVPVLDDVGRLQQAEGLLHVAPHHPWRALDGHALSEAGTEQAVVAPHGSVYHHRHLPLSIRQLHLESSQGLEALSEAAGAVLLRQEYLVAEPVRHLNIPILLPNNSATASQQCHFFSVKKLSKWT